jgi:hypothetical protein
MRKFGIWFAMASFGMAALKTADVFAGGSTAWTFERHVDTFANRAAFVASKALSQPNRDLVLYCNPHYNPATRESDPQFGPYYHVHLITLLDYGSHNSDYEIQYRLDESPLMKANIDYDNGVFAFLEPKKAKEFLDVLVKAKRVRFRVYNGTTIYKDFDFPLDGIQDIARQLMTECSDYK